MTDELVTATTRRSRPDAGDDTIDLGRMAHAIWRRKLLVVLLTFVGALLGLGISTLNTRYVSEGLLLMPEVSIEEYKRYEVALANEPRLVQFLELNEKSDEPIAMLLRDTIDTPGRLAEAIRPEFTYTDRDAKQFGVKFEGPGEFVGVRLKLQQREKTRDAPVLLLAEYVRDTAIKVDMESSILKRCLDYEMRERQLRNDQLDGEFFIKQHEAKTVSLKEIIERTPGAATIDGRQVVSLENGGERFLSPTAQLVGTEIVIADLRIEEAKRERDGVAASLKKEYYCKARAALQGAISGRRFLSSLEEMQSEVFTGKDMAVNILELTSNTLELERDAWNNTYLSQMRFVAAPDGAQVRVRKLGRALGLVLGTVLGGMAGVMLAFFLSWWRLNREAIIADED